MDPKAKWLLQFALAAGSLISLFQQGRDRGWI